MATIIQDAHRIFRAASRGTDKQIDAIEDEYGCGLSSILDELAAAAQDSGNQRLHKHALRAFNRLTGRDVNDPGISA